MMAKHALLSPSSAARWTSCPPSARLCEHIEEGPSLFAEEGTEAHTLCEYKVRLALGLPAQDPIPTLGFYNEQMEDCANEYTAFVLDALQQEKDAKRDPITWSRRWTSAPMCPSAREPPTASSSQIGTCT